MTQLHAGYVLDCVKDALEANFLPEEVRGLLGQLSHFDVDVRSTMTHRNRPDLDQLLSVAYNLVSRGLPTRPTLWLEDSILAHREGMAPRDERLFEDLGAIRRTLKAEKTFVQKLFRALHLIDPDLKNGNISKQKIRTWETLGSTFEEDFLYGQLPRHASPIWVQLFETQRELENVLRFSATAEDEIDKYLNGTVQTFNEQRLDFSVEFPYKTKGQRGFVVEIDGSQHEAPPQCYIDASRDSATEKAKWGRAIRIKTSDWAAIGNTIGTIRQFESEPFFGLLKQNFENPLYAEEEGLAALELTLVPFAVARIQKTLIHLLLEGRLDAKAEEWNVAVIERDVPCAHLAVEDFRRLMDLLFKLKGQDDRLPKINLFVEGNERFSGSDLRPFADPESGIDPARRYDLLIDLAVLQRSGLTDMRDGFEATTKVAIRSAHSPKIGRSFRTSELVAYRPLGQKNPQTHTFTADEEQVALLEEFVQTVFRKKSFRPGQAEILNRALQGQSVIGLLPTGSGKSLTYQLAALLQPGMAIVIDPIKSLMKDQFDGLLKNGIDGAVYINSSLDRKQREIALRKIKNAETIFAFVSPERLQDDTFRKELQETSEQKKHYFSYCVIDEAHCVSEWGHDFRTSYLRLGDNARTYCRAKSREHLPFFALTATASYDVLSDIQRELGIPEETAIVRLENMDRPEIQFKVIEVTADIHPGAGGSRANKKALGETKQHALGREVYRIPEYYEEFSNIERARIADAKEYGTDIRLPNFNPSTFYRQEGADSNAGLVFCPHRKWVFGVADNARALSSSFAELRIGTFMGSDGESERDIENEKSQSAFVNNKLNLLVATKAFGMGIDKPNIRYVVHFNYPSSIESYYQEAGRGGRDRKLALGLILFNRQAVSILEKTEKVTEDGEITEEMEQRTVSIDKDLLQSFHRNNFKGIAKEKRLLAELLTAIKFPSHRKTDHLEDLVLKEFSVPVSLRAAQNRSGRQVLYINPDVGSMYLDREHLPFYPAQSPIPEADRIASFVRETILAHKPDDRAVFDWLQQVTGGASQPGIEQRMADVKAGVPFTVDIPFTNDVIERITKYLEDNNIPISEDEVKKAQRFCNDKTDFIGKLHEKLYRRGVPIATISDEAQVALGNLFVQIRNEEDTYKAIYRLSIIGVVDDYTIDYNAKIIRARITKKPEGSYTGKLRDYLLQYNSTEKTDEKLERLPFYKGGTEIQKCLGFLIKFVYEETAIQRKAAIDAMEEACIIGLEKNGSQRFKDFIDMYMNSKYARPQYLPSDTNNGKKADFSIVEKYMDLVGSEVGQINNFKHLRGAATRLLVDNPDNFVFILLRSFSVFLVEKDGGDFVTEAQADFVRGFLKVARATKEDVRSLKRKVDAFKQKVFGFDLKAAENIADAEAALYLNLHTSWLKGFNDSFMGDLMEKNTENQNHA